MFLRKLDSWRLNSTKSHVGVFTGQVGSVICLTRQLICQFWLNEIEYPILHPSSPKLVGSSRVNLVRKSTDIYGYPQVGN